MIIYNERGEIVDITGGDLRKMMTRLLYGDDFYHNIGRAPKKGSGNRGGFNPTKNQLEAVDDGVYIRDYVDVDAIIKQSGIRPLKLGRRKDENSSGATGHTVRGGSQDQE